MHLLYVQNKFFRLPGISGIKLLRISNNLFCKRPATLLKKRLWHRCFPVNFVELLRAPFLQNTSGRQPLWIQLFLESGNVFQAECI